MSKYKIWDKQEPLYNDKRKYTAEEYLAENPWLEIPGTKLIISTKPMNLMAAMEFEQTKELYKNIGAAITDDMTDDQVLAAIQEFEDTPREAEVSADERIAAALEFQNLMSL